MVVSNGAAGGALVRRLPGSGMVKLCTMPAGHKADVCLIAAAERDRGDAGFFMSSQARIAADDT